jgi:GTP-binding protein Era
MLAEAWDVIRGADAVLQLHRLPEGSPPSLEALVPANVLGSKPRATVLTCTDLVPVAERPVVTPPTFLVDSPAGTGLEAVLSWCRANAPTGPFRFDPDDLSAQPLRFFVAEYVREAAFALLRDELPYALTAEVDEFREHSDPVYIRVVVYVERASHKGMVIGARGSTIKRIGQHARRRAEALLERHVYLDLWVKVLPRWRQSADVLRQLGFRLPPARSA